MADHFGEGPACLGDADTTPKIAADRDRDERTSRLGEDGARLDDRQRRALQMRRDRVASEPQEG
jgi:hypothetical protein